MAEVELEVEIVRETVIATRPGLDQEARTVALTFRYGRLPPLTVWIPEEEDTPEVRSSRIRAKLQEYLQRRPRKIKV